MDEPTTDELVDEIEFTYEYAAVPCELIENRPLTAREITATQVNGDPNACAGTPDSGSLVPFPDKNIWVAVIVSIFLHGSWLHIAGQHALTAGRLAPSEPLLPHVTADPTMAAAGT